VRRYATWGDEPFDQNIGAVVGRDGVVVIDTRASHRLADELRIEITELSRQPIVAVVNTHHHWDHTFGNARFLPSPIWGHARCAERVRADGDAMRARVIGQAPEFADELGEVVFTPPDQVFSDTATIDLADRELRLAHLGHGHTDNDIVIEVPDAGVLFAGDLLENDAAPSYGDAFPRAWAATVTERLLPLVRDAVVPGHGGVGDRSFVAAQAADLTAMAELGARLAAGELDTDDAVGRAPFPAATTRTALSRALQELAG
jgi:glyoxylase-like metal-dependent hydrolase (beta-lactamase superfamily II)